LRSTAIIAALIAATAPLCATAGELAGTVYDQRGRPAAGVELSLGDAHVVSGADGAFMFADLAAGDAMLAAGNQRVAVSIPAQGTVRRNLFLLSRSARATVTGETAPTPESDAALAATVRLAEAMLQDTAGQPNTAWRWNDLEG
jgi:hypothetical protein